MGFSMNLPDRDQSELKRAIEMINKNTDRYSAKEQAQQLKLNCQLRYGHNAGYMEDVEYFFNTYLSRFSYNSL